MSAALTASGFEVLDQYAQAESPECSVLVVSHSKLLKTFSPIRAAAMPVFSDIKSGHNFHQLTNSDLFVEYGIFGECIPTGRVFKSGGCY